MKFIISTLWAAIAWVISKPFIARAIIRRAQKTPYSPILGRTIYGLGPYPDAVPVVRTQADYSREWRKNNLALCRARGRKTPASPWAGLGA